MVAGAPHTRRGFPSSSREAPRAMFEESEWDGDEAAPPAPEQQQQQQQLQAPRLPRGPAAGGGAGRRRHLLATLRRLEGSASHRPPSASSSGGSDQEEEEGVAGDLEAERRGKKRRRTRRREKKGAAEHPGLPGYPEEKRRRGDCGSVSCPPARHDPIHLREGGSFGGVLLEGRALSPSPALLAPPGRESIAHSLCFCPGGAAAVVAGTDGASARPHSSPKGPGAEEGPAEEGVGQPLLTRKQWRNRQKNKRRQKNKFKALGGLPAARQMPEDAHSHTTTAGEPAGSPETGGPTPAEPLGGRAASLRLRMAERLEAARFRHLNQQLYSRPSWEAAPLFQQDPEAFAAYHRGFAQQMARWPEKPVQRIVRYLRHRPASLIVADFGCGDCTLARSLRNKVHCFDLVALDPRVTACDMAQVPLEAESVDVTVFCLALMGTNVQEILGEASRVLRMGGTLLVAEVASRFPDVRAFVGALARLGFALRSKDLSGSHFYTFEFAKVAVVPGKAKPLPGLALRPCLYKRR